MLEVLCAILPLHVSLLYTQTLLLLLHVMLVKTRRLLLCRSTFAKDYCKSTQKITASRRNLSLWKRSGFYFFGVCEPTYWRVSPEAKKREIIANAKEPVIRREKKRTSSSSVCLSVRRYISVAAAAASWRRVCASVCKLFKQAVDKLLASVWWSDSLGVKLKPPVLLLPFPSIFFQLKHVHSYLRTDVQADAAEEKK